MLSKASRYTDFTDTRFQFGQLSAPSATDFLHIVKDNCNWLIKNVCCIIILVLNWTIVKLFHSLCWATCGLVIFLWLRNSEFRNHYDFLQLRNLPKFADRFWLVSWEQSRWFFYNVECTIISLDEEVLVMHLSWLAVILLLHCTLNWLWLQSSKTAVQNQGPFAKFWGIFQSFANFHFSSLHNFPKNVLRDNNQLFRLLYAHWFSYNWPIRK